MSRYMSKMYLQYCKDNKLEDVRACLSEGVDVNAVSDNGRWSALTIAAHKNLPDLLELVLSQPGIKVNMTTDAKAAGWSECQWTPLTFACHAGHSAIVARLVEVDGLAINYQDQYGDIACHWACMMGHTACVQVLANTERADWNRRNMWGQTPLWLALSKGYHEIVNILVRQQGIAIDYSVRNNYGQSLAQVAVCGGSERCVESLAGRPDCLCWSVLDENGDTPAMAALKDDKREIVEILVRCPRVDLSCRNSEGWSLLFRAIAENEIGK